MQIDPELLSYSTKKTHPHSQPHPLLHPTP